MDVTSTSIGIAGGDDIELKQENTEMKSNFTAEIERIKEAIGMDLQTSK